MLYLPNDPGEINPFVFLPIPGCPNHWISLAGQVRNSKRGTMLKISINYTGSRCYPRCSLGHTHRLLMSAIMGRALDTRGIVCHRNGDTHDNRPCNLRVGTAHQNALDRVLDNTNGRILRNQDVRDIRALAGVVPVRELARRYGVSKGHVRAIQAGRVWRNLP